MHSSMHSIVAIATVVALSGSFAACGTDTDSPEKRSAPAPRTSGTDSEAFALESGTYYLDEVRNLQDGCGKRPLDSDDPITQVPFTLTNDGEGTVTMDFCSYDDSSVEGDVRGNAGLLHVIHDGREIGTDTYVARFDQECRINIAVTADNTIEGRYTEMQRGRNAAMKAATVDLDECTTSFAFTMKKRD